MTTLTPQVLNLRLSLQSRTRYCSTNCLVSTNAFNDYYKRFQHPVSVAFTSFSKVTNFIQDFINPQEIQVRPANERATLIDDDLTTEAVGSSRIRIKRGEGSSGFEVITCVSASFVIVLLKRFKTAVNSLF